MLPLKFAERRIRAGVRRERNVPDDTRDAKISGPVNYNPIVARNGSNPLNDRSDALRGEVEQFLNVIRSDANTEERRRFERIPGNGTSVTLRAQGSDIPASLRDLSRGGAALNCDRQLPTGILIELELPHGAGKASGRMVRSDGREMALVFNGDPASLARIDKAMDLLSSRRAA